MTQVGERQIYPMHNSIFIYQPQHDVYNSSKKGRHGRSCRTKLPVNHEICSTLRIWQCVWPHLTLFWLLVITFTWGGAAVILALFTRGVVDEVVFRGDVKNNLFLNRASAKKSEAFVRDKQENGDMQARKHGGKEGLLTQKHLKTFILDFKVDDPPSKYTESHEREDCICRRTRTIFDIINTSKETDVITSDHRTVWLNAAEPNRSSRAPKHNSSRLWQFNPAALTGLHMGKLTGNCTKDAPHF